MISPSTLKYILPLVLFVFIRISTKAQDDDFYSKLSGAAIRLTHNKVTYDLLISPLNIPMERYLQIKMIIHNIGRSQVIEDCLFSLKITEHYRYKK